MSNKGWVCIDRKILDNEIWLDGKFSRGQAWIDLILLANHTDKTILFDGTPITVKRGQHVTSIRKLSDRWGWCRDKTAGFLSLLESNGMIQRESNNKRTLVTVVNYGKYQDWTDTNQDTNQDANQAQTTMYNNDNNDINTNPLNNINNIHTICPSDLELADVSPIPLKDGTEWIAPQKYVDELAKTFPGVDLAEEFRRARMWSMSNPQKQKTKGGVKRFINSWMERSRQKYENTGFSQGDWTQKKKSKWE